MRCDLISKHHGIAQEQFMRGMRLLMLTSEILSTTNKRSSCADSLGQVSLTESNKGLERREPITGDCMIFHQH